MLSLVRPSRHTSFTQEAHDELVKLRAAVAAGNGKLPPDAFKKTMLWSGSWKGDGRHKLALAGVGEQTAKCAWCERLRDVSRELDVEHYRPKAVVTQWVGHPPLVSDEPPREVTIGPGYWWLAFSWENYSLSCKLCNQGWKRNLFPVANDPRLSCVEGVEQLESPLLLDPMTPFRTRDHFAWTIDGFMDAVSPQGRATIITCGLNRRPLPALRFKVAEDVRAALANLRPRLDANSEGPILRAFQSLLRLGARDAEFTGMVRWMVENDLDCDWDDLERFRG